MANELKREAEIFAVGVTNQTDDAFLADISSGGVRDVDWFHAATFEGLRQIRDQVVQQTCITSTSQTTTPTTTPTTTTVSETTSNVIH